ncbi:hypothetical protein DL239_03730 [Sedimentitalea sp. CY04]|uniref:Uncharacterized protein n=1 Tax=Parasedimentitalea denitrificans TaxID=2211118 RepID=A0ABX0W375_9RHOB|nr:hypothetical protein [Sedimentitalea sp. CY04]
MDLDGETRRGCKCVWLEGFGKKPVSKKDGAAHAEADGSSTRVLKAVKNAPFLREPLVLWPGVSVLAGVSRRERYRRDGLRAAKQGVRRTEGIATVPQRGKGRCLRREYLGNEKLGDCVLVCRQGEGFCHMGRKLL